MVQPRQEVRLRVAGQPGCGRLSPSLRSQERRLCFGSAGTSLRVRVETDRGRLRVVEVVSVDTRTALGGEPAPIPRATEWGKRVGPSGIRVGAHAMVATRSPADAVAAVEH